MRVKVVMSVLIRQKYSGIIQLIEFYMVKC